MVTTKPLYPTLTCTTNLVPIPPHFTYSFQLVRQMTQINQHFHIGKTADLPDVFMHYQLSPTTTTLPTHFNLSHKWPHFANIFTLVKQAVCRTFSCTTNLVPIPPHFTYSFQLVPQTTQICQHFHIGKSGCLSDVFMHYQNNPQVPPNTHSLTNTTKYYHHLSALGHFHMHYQQVPKLRERRHRHNTRKRHQN